MARKIDFVSGLFMYDGTASFPNINNFLCCSGCQSIVCTFENVHNSSLTLDSINLTFQGQIQISVLSINGSPPSFPYILDEGDTFTVTFSICFDPNQIIIEDYWKFYFTTVEHSNEQFFYVPMNCVTIEDLVTNQSVDFGNVPVNSTQSQIISIQNTTFHSIDYDVNVDLCDNATVTNGSGTIISGGTAFPQISWTPTAFPENLSCFAVITEPNNPGECYFDLPVSGSSTNYDCDPDDKICCLNVTLRTDNDYLLPYDDLCEEADLIYSSAILDKKQIIYDAKYGGGQILPGFKVYFNPFLFATSGTEFGQYNNPPSGSNPNNPPANAWYFQLMPSFLPGNAYAMQLIGGGTYPLTQKNFSAFLTIIDATLGIFRVTFNFYMVADFQSPINTSLFNNQFKFSKSRISNPTEFNNSLPSVYSEDRKILSLIFVVDPNPPAFAPNGFKTALINNINYTSRFYNRGLYDNVSEFTSPTWILSRNIGTVNNLSVFEPTKVTFNITVDSNEYTGVQAIVFHMIDRTLNVPSMFLDATDSSRGEIQNLPAGIGVIDNHLILPSTFTYLGSDVWEASCYVDTSIDPTHNYMIFAIVYGQDGYMVNTFKSNQYGVKRSPDYDCDCVPKIESHWDNYFETRETDDYRPVGKERIKHRLIVEDGAFGNCIQDWGLDVDDWRSLLTQVNLRIYKRQLYFPSNPNQDYATFFEYGNYTSIRDNSALYGWQNLGALVVSDENIDQIHLEINNIRVPWESTTFNGNVSQCKMETYMDKYPITGPNATNYINALNVVNSWIDEDVYFEYEFIFDLSSYFGEPFTFSICRAFMVSAISFENVNSGFPPHIVNFQFEGYDPTINTWIPLPTLVNALNYSQLRLIYTSDDIAPYIGWFNFFIEEFPYGLSTLTESNAAASPNGLQNYGLADMVISQSVQYSVNANPPYEAHVYIDTSELRTTSYRFCGYWTERTLTPTCTYLNRHDNMGGTTQYIQMNTPQLTNDLAMVFLNVPLNRFLYVRSRNIAASLPVVGGTYYFHYNFASATTRVINIWFSRHDFTGAPTVTIPVGETIGAIMFTMPIGPLSPDFWTIRFEAGTDYSGAGVFKIGNEYCE